MRTKSYNCIESNHQFLMCSIQDAGMPCLFGRNKWTPQEEIHLLDATEYYGFGNWEDIANHIETRTPEGKSEKLRIMFYFYNPEWQRNLVLNILKRGLSDIFGGL